MWRRNLAVALVLVLAALSSSCGYALAGRGSFLPDYLRVIAIPLFTDKTPYVTVEPLFTEKVRVEFQTRPYNHVVTFANVSLDPEQRTEVKVEKE